MQMPGNREREKSRRKTRKLLAGAAVAALIKMQK